MWLLLVLSVRLESKPASHFDVKYFNGRRFLHAVTDSRGIAVLPDKLSERDVWPESKDYVFRNLRRSGRRWQVDALRSATWRQRHHPRPCDAWRAVLDIPRGNLESESAAEYEQWYSSLTPAELANCATLSSIEARVGSKAPWYLYEIEGLEPACVNGKYVGELDWVAWYRGLLEKATGASPGKCLSDWQRWWASKGYPPVPERPHAAPF
jgi:hypothetical protein